MVGQCRETHPAVRQQAGHVRAGEAVAEEDQRYHRQGRAKGATRGLQQQRNADASGDQVHGGEVAGALCQLLISDEQIAGACGSDQPERDVDQWHSVAR